MTQLEQYFVSADTNGDGEGFGDSGRGNMCRYQSTSGANYLNSSNLVYSELTGGGAYSGLIKSYYADGMTITWTRGGTPSGTITMVLQFYK